MDWRRRFGDAVRRGRMADEEVPGKADPDEGHGDRDRHQAVLGRLTMRGLTVFGRPGIGLVPLVRRVHIADLARSMLPRLEARFEVMLDPVASAERCRNSDVAGDDRTDGQHDQRERHCRRRVVQMSAAGVLVASWRMRMPMSMRVMTVACTQRVPRRPVEGQEDQAEHVAGRQERRQHADHPEHGVAAEERLREDLVLAEEPGQPGHAGNGDRADQEGPVGDRQVLLEPAHFSQILFAVQRVNHRTGSEEQQRLEEGVCVEMEDPRAERADPHRQEHVTELRDGRIRQHALDVVLDQADRAREKRRRRPNHRNHQHRLGRVAEQHGVPANHVHARRHHRRRVNQRRDWRRTFHRVRQPDVQRNLCGFAGGADEQQQRRNREHAPARLDRELRNAEGDLLEIDRMELGEEKERAEDEREVADTVDDERLLGGVRRGLLLVPEADQQVRAEADALPPDEHHRQAGAEDQHQHEGGEQVQIREVPGVLAVGLLVHVGGRVDVNQRANAGDDEDHHRRKAIEVERRADVQVSRRDPRIRGLQDAGPGLQHRIHRGQRHSERRHQRRAGDTAGDRLRQPPAEEGVEDEAGERQQRNQSEHGIDGLRITTSDW